MSKLLSDSYLASLGAGAKRRIGLSQLSSFVALTLLALLCVNIGQTERAIGSVDSTRQTVVSNNGNILYYNSPAAVQVDQQHIAIGYLTNRTVCDIVLSL